MSSSIVPIVMAVLGFVVSVAGLIYTISRNRNKDSAEYEHRFSVVETKVERLIADAAGNDGRFSALETKIDLFWRNLSVDAARILHSPDPAKARQDYLLEQFMADTIVADELVELAGLMDAIANDHDSAPGDRLAASVILRAIQNQFGMIAS